MKPHELANTLIRGSQNLNRMQGEIKTLISLLPQLQRKNQLINITIPTKNGQLRIFQPAQSVEISIVFKSEEFTRHTIDVKKPEEIPLKHVIDVHTGMQEFFSIIMSRPEIEKAAEPIFQAAQLAA